jgi:putative oxidoreductase
VSETQTANVTLPPLPGLATSLALLLARILIVALFLPAGIGKITGFAGAVQYAAAAGLPMPQVAVVVAIILELALPVFVIAGFQTRISALVLLVFTLVATWYFHAFWTFEGPQRVQQALAFYKNLSVIGGLLLLGTLGPGRFAIAPRQ